MISVEATLICPKTGFVVGFDCDEESVVGFSKVCVFQGDVEGCESPSTLNIRKNWLCPPVSARSFPYCSKSGTASDRDQPQRQFPSSTVASEPDLRREVTSKPCLQLPETLLDSVHHSISRGSLRHAPTAQRPLSTKSLCDDKNREGRRKLANLFDSDG